MKLSDILAERVGDDKVNYFKIIVNSISSFVTACQYTFSGFDSRRLHHPSLSDCKQSSSSGWRANSLKLSLSFEIYAKDVRRSLVRRRAVTFKDLFKVIPLFSIFSHEIRLFAAKHLLPQSAIHWTYSKCR